MQLTKEYVGANASNIPNVVEKILKKYKDDTRKGALEVIECGICLMYKSYLLRGNQSFLVTLEKLLKAKEAILQNGHVKLQLIANML